MGQVTKLEKHLVLNKYFLSLFGFRDFRDARSRFGEERKEGYDSSGRSYFVDALIGLDGRFTDDELLGYDASIRGYVERLRANRRQPWFNLKYFQYLAVLFSEIFLERVYTDREGFLEELNKFLVEFNQENRTDIPPFTESDLYKLAFWMATGSGKTLIMHINYWQILKHAGDDWDNIILITPNEGLSRQHEKELRMSGIPCRLYDGNPDNVTTRKGEILVIDIHKLTEKKEGEGVTIDVSCFEGRNLVFVDEGHKGQASEEKKWKRLREKIGENGFVIEYSATFGQVVGRNNDLLYEYGKSILFDYSYKYFYEDGYGKDFYVYHMEEQEYTDYHREMMLTASLLSFYQQLLAYEEYGDQLREYNLERPLWVFVGSRVSGRALDSEIVIVVEFLKRVLEDPARLGGNISRILGGSSGLTDERGRDIFEGRFPIVKERWEAHGGDVQALVRDIYERVFNGGGSLELYEIKNADGEIGLKTSTSDKYFGVINVGDVASLKKVLPESIEVKPENMEGSLFHKIDEHHSSVNVLIGAKKFIEGWNSWRVSNMCLLRIGQSEGPQIIQLFGRGVRLKGREWSLKREETPDQCLKLLQTLYIFGLDSKYIVNFLETIKREGLEQEEHIEYVPVRLNIPEKWENKIYVIEKEEGFDFLEHPVVLSVDEDVLSSVSIDIRPRIVLAHGLDTQTAKTTTDQQEIPEEVLELIDWDRVHLEVMNHKVTRRYYNLIIDKSVLKKIAGKKRKIYATPDQVSLDSFEKLRRLEDLIIMIIKTYIDKYYKKKERKETMKHLGVEPLRQTNIKTYISNEIILKIPKSLIDELEGLIQQIEEYRNNREVVPESEIFIHFERHLYTPLIGWSQRTEELKSIPVKLNRGETRFVEDLKSFLENTKRALGTETEIFLLRNLSKRGVGFFTGTADFYPDFILWARQGKKQKIVFIDPKGLSNLGNIEDEKIRFCSSYINEIEAALKENIKRKRLDPDLELYAFIISVTPYEKLRLKWHRSPEELEQHNILFQEDREYTKKLFEKIGVL